MWRWCPSGIQRFSQYLTQLILLHWLTEGPGPGPRRERDKLGPAVVPGRQAHKLQGHVLGSCGHN